MTIDFKGVFRNKNREQRKINDLERLESRRWVRSVARQLHLDSVSERKIRSGDASIDYFEPPIQHFLPAIQTPAFIELDRELGGYDITGLMKVVLNKR